MSDVMSARISLLTVMFSSRSVLFSVYGYSDVLSSVNVRLSRSGCTEINRLSRQELTGKTAQQWALLIATCPGFLRSGESN
jgi:hypothetical protein